MTDDQKHRKVLKRIAKDVQAMEALKWLIDELDIQDARALMDLDLSSPQAQILKGSKVGRNVLLINIDVSGE